MPGTFRNSIRSEGSSAWSLKGVLHHSVYSLHANVLHCVINVLLLLHLWVVCIQTWKHTTSTRLFAPIINTCWFSVSRKPEGFWPLRHMWYSLTGSNGSAFRKLQHLESLVSGYFLTFVMCSKTKPAAPACPNKGFGGNSSERSSFKQSISSPYTTCENRYESGGSILHFRSYQAHKGSRRLSRLLDRLSCLCLRLSTTSTSTNYPEIRCKKRIVGFYNGSYMCAAVNSGHRVFIDRNLHII